MGANGTNELKQQRRAWLYQADAIWGVFFKKITACLSRGSAKAADPTNQSEIRVEMGAPNKCGQ